MEFILRILFSGLMAFVPSEDGTELTVLLLDVDHAYHTSDGSPLPTHKPLLLARAGNCTGQCPKRDSAIAEFLFADKSQTAALDSLETAVAGGGAWQLAGSELSLRKGSTNAPDLPPLVLRKGLRGTVNGQLQTIPTTSTEREDYTWLSDLKQICPSGCSIDTSNLSSQAPARIAARLRLRSGSVFTYSVARIGPDVTPVRFERFDGEGSASPYSQAVASWMAADLQISGSSVEIVETTFAGDPSRSMMLTPDANGKIEIAVLNLPPFVPPASSSNKAPIVGRHFEAYYDLLQSPPAQETRLVPRAGAPAGAPAVSQVDWSTIHPQSALWSELLNQIRLNAGRSAYDRTLCPPTEVSDP